MPFQKPRGAPGAILYGRGNCGFSRAVRVAIDNLHLHGVEIRNVSRDEDALRALREISDAETAPCLVVDAEVVGESSAIITLLADRESDALAESVGGRLAEIRANGRCNRVLGEA